MMKKLPYLLLIFSCSVQNVDKIYYNGVIWTGDLKNPSATALVVSGDHILFVGSEDNIYSCKSGNLVKASKFGNIL